MNRVRHFCATAILTLSVAFTGFAGEMPTGIHRTPPPQHPVTTEAPALAAGELSAVPTQALDPVTEVTLFLIDGLMLSLF